MISKACPGVGSKKLPFIKVEPLDSFRFIAAVHMPSGSVFIEDVEVGWTAHDLKLIKSYLSKDDAVESAMDFLTLYEAGFYVDNV